MKNYLLTLFFAGIALFAKAETTPHALGFHIGGSTIDLEYQYHLNQKNFLDFTVGVFDIDDGFLAQGIYNWNIQKWGNWTPSFATWKIWGGIGAGVGYIDADKHDDSMMLGPVGTIGFGFTMKAAPITMGIDYRPMVAIALGHHSGLVDHGFRNIGFTMTYRF